MLPMSTTRTLSPKIVRRLAVMRQHLAGSQPNADSDGILQTVQNIGCLQLDPINAVARSPLLVLWSRVGKFDVAHLDHLLWKERCLFEYWAHAASIVLTEDYPIHHARMRTFPKSRTEGTWSQRIRQFMQDNAQLHDHILDSLTKNGPMFSRQFEDESRSGWDSSGWTSGRNVSRMLDFMWIGGEIMVAGRNGGQKQWDLTERCLPDWTPRDILDEHDVVYRAAQTSLRALGVGTALHIKRHYIQGRYPNLPAILKELEADGLIERVQIEDEGEGKQWPGPWYIHTADLPLLEKLMAGEWEPRTVLLSPFDNLICNRDRTEQLFNFFFRIEIYVPQKLRQYGYYVLPILHGDQLIGRIDPLMDRKNKRLNVNAVYAEPDAPMTAETARAISYSINELADFLGAKEIAYGQNVPKGWKRILR
jgi:uncharacterized protein YcaQ